MRSFRCVLLLLPLRCTAYVAPLLRCPHAFAFWIVYADVPVCRLHLRCRLRSLRLRSFPRLLCVTLLPATVAVIVCSVGYVVHAAPAVRAAMFVYCVTAHARVPRFRLPDYALFVPVRVLRLLPSFCRCCAHWVLRCWVRLRFAVTPPRSLVVFAVATRCCLPFVAFGRLLHVHRACLLPVFVRLRFRCVTLRCALDLPPHSFAFAVTATRSFVVILIVCLRSFAVYRVSRFAFAAPVCVPVDFVIVCGARSPCVCSAAGVAFRPHLRCTLLFTFAARYTLDLRSFFAHCVLFCVCVYVLRAFCLFVLPLPRIMLLRTARADRSLHDFRVLCRSDRFAHVRCFIGCTRTVTRSLPTTHTLPFTRFAFLPLPIVGRYHALRCRAFAFTTDCVRFVTALDRFTRCTPRLRCVRVTFAIFTVHDCCTRLPLHLITFPFCTALRYAPLYRLLLVTRLRCLCYRFTVAVQLCCSRLHHTPRCARFRHTGSFFTGCYTYVGTHTGYLIYRALLRVCRTIVSRRTCRGYVAHTVRVADFSCRLCRCVRLAHLTTAFMPPRIPYRSCTAAFVALIVFVFTRCVPRLRIPHGYTLRYRTFYRTPLRSRVRYYLTLWCYAVARFVCYCVHRIRCLRSAAHAYVHARVR